MSMISIAARAMGLGLVSLLFAGCIGDTDNATNVTTSSARLNGHGRPDGGAVWIKYYFKWGKTTAYSGPGSGKSTTVTINQPLNETINYPVWHDLTGLESGQTYYFTVCGRDSNDNWGTADGFYCGANKSFTTPGVGVIGDGGFEGQTAPSISSPWIVEGQDPKGIDLQGHAFSGLKNAWFNQTTFRWNAFRQTVAVEPNTNYALHAWVETGGNAKWEAITGEVGIREANNVTVIANQRFGDHADWMRIRVDFNSASHTSINVYVGTRGLRNGLNAWMRVDEIVLEKVSVGPGAAQSAVPPVLTVAPPSAFSAIVEEQFNSITTKGQNDGDLWPACWGADDMVYTANGDGTGFGQGTYDLTVSRVSGSPYNTPPRLWGDRLAVSDAVASVWSGTQWNRKPTGMLCLGSDIYIAVQDLRKPPDFNLPLAASISVSHNGGFTWEWDHSEEMFGGGKFTTIFFLDFGKGGQNSFDNYVYVYGLDDHWAGRPDLYLARVPKTSVMDRSTWTFFNGIDSVNGEVRWTTLIGEKDAVLQAPLFSGGFLSQGSVVYNPYFNRYLYSTWIGSEGEVHRVYEAPAPWGPWTLIMDHSFPGEYSATNHGGYATTTPSKWINHNGTVMMLQSNYFHVLPKMYSISLRKVTLTPAP